jgi:hypothetical protein
MDLPRKYEGGDHFQLAHDRVERQDFVTILLILWFYKSREFVDQLNNYQL